VHLRLPWGTYKLLRGYPRSPQFGKREKWMGAVQKEIDAVALPYDLHLVPAVQAVCRFKPCQVVLEWIGKELLAQGGTIDIKVNKIPARFAQAEDQTDPAPQEIDPERQVLVTLKVLFLACRGTPISSQDISPFDLYHLPARFEGPTLCLSILEILLVDKHLGADVSGLQRKREQYEHDRES
jgi:hypothetical protein